MDIDDEFYRYYVDTSLKMLESRKLLKKYSEISSVIFRILQETVIPKMDVLRNV